MQLWMVCAIALASITICLFLWFRDVRRIMRERSSMVESAAGQLASFRKKASETRCDPELTKVLIRSESIYNQSVDLYHQALNRPWNWIPARLMGFHPISGERFDAETEDTAEKSLNQPLSEEPPAETTGYFGSVRFFKNMILLAVIIMIAVPSALAIHLNKNLRQSESDLQELSLRLDEAQQAIPAPGNSTAPEQSCEEAAVSDAISAASLWDAWQAESPYGDLYPDFYAPQDPAANVRKTGVIYLTFDDGPSPRTAEILDTLKEKNVKATFFVIGSHGQENEALLRRIAEEGHTLAMHSYSHSYGKIYASVEDYLSDMYEIFTQIRDATGVTPTLFRFPGGSINGYNNAIYQDLISEMIRRGFIPFDWNISSEDAATTGLVPAEKLVSNVLTAAGRVERGIVLMHDSAPKTTTVQALGPMIDGLRDMGFELEALTPDTMPVLYAYKE